MGELRRRGLVDRCRLVDVAGECHDDDDGDETDLEEAVLEFGGGGGGGGGGAMKASPSASPSSSVSSAVAARSAPIGTAFEAGSTQWARLADVHSPYYLQRFSARRMRRLATADALYTLYRPRHLSRGSSQAKLASSSSSASTATSTPSVSSTASSYSSALLEEASQYDSVYLAAESATAAKLAVECCLGLTEALRAGRIANGLAVVRPPGHHAEPCAAKGFCLFNNVAVCAAMILGEAIRQIG